VSTLPGKLVITGDFNIYWEDDNDPEKKEFDELLNVFNLIQLVRTSTHISGHILDFLLTRANDDVVHDVKVSDMISDHCLLTSSLNLPKPKVEKDVRTFRKIKNIDKAKFCSDLNEAIGSIRTDDNPDFIAGDLNQAMLAVLDLHAPVQTKVVSTKSRVPWFNDEIRNSICERRRLERQWRNDKIEIKRQMLRDARNKTAYMINQSKIKYYNEKINDCNKDQRKLYDVINNLMHRKEETKLPSGTVAELVQSFNSFFVSKIDSIREKIASCNNSTLQTTPSEPCAHVFSNFNPVNEDDVKKTITGSKNATCELDSIPTELLKESIPVITPSLVKLFNCSLLSGIVPLTFKHAIVKPLIKKTSLDPENLKNFRPISNLPFLSKVLEKLVAKQLNDYMTQNNLHEKMQSAYKKAHSTETALLRIQNDILLKLDNKKGVILVLLDLSAAFDTIDHSILLQRLQHTLGITGTALKWFSSYLCERTSAISIGGKTSDQSQCKYGVPQGSVLGPILFTIYTMPLADIISSHNLEYHFYADDTQLYISFNPKQQPSFHQSLNFMEQCIMEIKSWMNINMLKLNEDKTEVLYIASPHFQKSIQDCHLSVNNISVSRTHSARNIGVIFDDEMLMKENITSVCKKSIFHLRNIGRIRRYLTHDSCTTLVHSLVSSRIDYCNSLLVNLPATSLDKLQRVLNTAARIVSLRPKSEHITPVLFSLHWLPVKQRIDYKVILLVFRCMHNMCPTYLSELLTVYVPKRDLRSAERALLDYKAPSTKYGERAFSVAGATLWNGIPEDIRILNNIGTFKSKLKTWLFREAFKHYV